MSKRNREKRTQVRSPFRALNMWIKHYDSMPQQCITCKSEIATYALEEWLFSHRQIALDPYNSALIDRLWSEAVQNQMAGKYKRAGVFYECEECTLKTVSHMVGEQPATLTFVMTKLAPWMSIVIGCKVENSQDDGPSFITLVPDNLNVETLGQQMNNPECYMDINLKESVQG